MSDSMLVRNYMNDRPAKVTCGMPVQDVVNVLLKHKISGAPVVDENNKLLGFVSEQDCIHQLLVEIYHGEVGASVNDIMANEVLTVSPEESMVDLAQRMQTAKPKLYPVIEGGKLVGLVSRTDVLQSLVHDAKRRS